MEMFYVQLATGLVIAIIGYFLKSTIEESKNNANQIMNLKQANAETTLKLADMKENVLQKQTHLEEMTNLKLDNIFRELKEIKTDLRIIKNDKD